MAYYLKAFKSSGIQSDIPLDQLVPEFAPGAALEQSLSILSGSANGSALVAGAICESAWSLIPGAASVSGDVLVEGGEFAEALSLLDGAATGGAVVEGATVEAALSLLPGSATGGAAGSCPTVDEIVAGLLAAEVEAGYSVRDVLRLYLAALTGQTTGVRSDSILEKFWSVDGLTPRIVANYDAQGNRIGVTLDPG